MATIEQRVCDVYGTTKEVKRYAVIVIENEQAVTLKELCVSGHDLIRSADLSLRGRGRLIKFINRGLTPPGKRAADAPKDSA